MREYETSMTEKGQVTIPQEIRRIMGLHPHDKVHFHVKGEEITITRASSKLLTGFGAVTPKNQPEDFHKLRKAFEEGVAEDVATEA
jgi:AbrB family looped-hinge helix DNA binding protein